MTTVCFVCKTSHSVLFRGRCASCNQAVAYLKQGQPIPLQTQSVPGLMTFTVLEKKR